MLCALCIISTEIFHAFFRQQTKVSFHMSFCSIMPANLNLVLHLTMVSHSLTVRRPTAGQIETPRRIRLHVTNNLKKHNKFLQLESSGPLRPPGPLDFVHPCYMAVPQLLLFRVLD